MGGMAAEHDAELEELRREIAAASWRTTQYIQEHQYISRGRYPRLFDLIAARIKTHGYSARFQGRSYRYMDLDGYKYWRFRIICNREKLPE